MQTTIRVVPWRSWRYFGWAYYASMGRSNRKRRKAERYTKGQIRMYRAKTERAALVLTALLFVAVFVAHVAGQEVPLIAWLGPFGFQVFRIRANVAERIAPDS